MAQKFGVVTGEVPERAIIVGIDRGSDSAWPINESLDELERLTETAGAVVVHRMTQRLDAPNPRTFIGSGKAAELHDAVMSLQADLVVFDDELTPSQQSNLEHVVGKPVKVIDRTALILDIFALHAKSREGRLQVKLAQNQYLYPRLRGMWSHLAAHRMGGGVGSRFGEGESQLEVDRRLVRKRIGSIRKELKELASSRAAQRKHRNKSGVFRIALAGYTNAGKSTLMNSLTNADVLAYDKLFATLDSTTRQLVLGQQAQATITDTVGFIQKLPHTLIEAFHSTLDEIREADLICVIVDVAAAQRDAQLDTVLATLQAIGAQDIARLTVYNKIDLASDDGREMPAFTANELARLRELNPDAVFVSSQTGEGLDELIERLGQAMADGMTVLDLLIPYDKGNLVDKAFELGDVQQRSYEERGVKMTLRISADRAASFLPYTIEQTGDNVS